MNSRGSRLFKMGQRICYKILYSPVSHPADRKMAKKICTYCQDGVSGIASENCPPEVVAAIILMRVPSQ